MSSDRYKHGQASDRAHGFKARVMIPCETYISYVIDIEELSVGAAEKVVLGDDFDPSDWETDPDFYENVADNIEQAFRHRREKIIIEKIDEQHQKR